MNEPIISLFSSQSIEPWVILNKEEDKDDVTVGFVELEFNPEEGSTKDHAIMSGKQFKILNSKINSMTLLEGVDKSIDEHLATHSRTFNHEIIKLQDVTHEGHVLFEKLMTTSRTSIDM